MVPPPHSPLTDHGILPSPSLSENGILPPALLWYNLHPNVQYVVNISSIYPGPFIMQSDHLTTRDNNTSSVYN